MDELLFNIIQVIVMIAVIVATRYVIPWLKGLIDSEKLSQVAQWAEKAVLYAQQTLTSSTGAEKKSVVTQFLQEILTAKNISLTDEQIEVLIESAVKSMKISESAATSTVNVQVNEGSAATE